MICPTEGVTDQRIIELWNQHAEAGYSFMESIVLFGRALIEEAEQKNSIRQNLRPARPAIGERK